ncbi:MAG TPA: hypothetical protein DCS93_19635 [Microscillaceae bacterium]|nr:hypothetical protein [Microscillaceae bacterium]
MHLQLTPEQSNDFHEALLHAFRNYDDLRLMLRHQLNKRLEEITAPKALNLVVLEILESAESEGWLYDLLQAARNQKPGNPRLKSFEASLTIPIKPEASQAENPIESALQGLESGDFVNFFEEMEKVTPSDQRTTLSQLRGQYIAGNLPYNFPQRLRLFALDIQKLLK